jgi:hypothetical protein
MCKIKSAAFLKEKTNILSHPLLMLNSRQLLEAIRCIRPVLPNLIAQDQAQQLDDQFAELLNQPDLSEGDQANQLIALLQRHPETVAWLGNFLHSTTQTRSNSSLPGDPAVQSATKYVCPEGDDYTHYREGTEAIPLCPTHLVSLVPAQP